MSEAEWVELSEVPSIADERWLYSANGGDRRANDSWTPINLALVPDEPPVQPTLGGLGLAYPGKRHVFSGPQESAKTLCAYVIGLEVLRAGAFFCLIDFEMGRWDARNRLRELGATNDELGKILYFEPFEPMSGEATVRILEGEPALVIIDAAAGAYDLQGLDDNKRSDVERFTRIYVRDFWQAGIATIVLDHVVKNVEGRGRYAIGSERKVGGADVHLGFETIAPIKRGSHGLYKITTHKDRGGFLRRGKLADFELRSDPSTHLIRWEFRLDEPDADDAPFRPTHLMEKVSRYLELQSEPVSQNQVEKTVEGRAKFVRLALDLLVTEAYVRESEGPRQGRMFVSLRHFREAENSENPLRPTSSATSSGTQSTLLVPPRPPLTGDGDGETAEDEVENRDFVRDEVDDDGIPF